MLSLTEELFLLSLVEKKLTITLPETSIMSYALAGAMLVELTLAGKIRLEKDRRLLPVEPVDLNTSPHLAELLKQICAAEKPHKITYWISAAAGKGRKLEETLFADLIERGVLKKEEKRVFWVLPHTEYSQQDASAKYLVKQRLRDMVLAGQPADAQSVALLSLLRTMNLLENLFTPDEIKAAGKQVAEIICDEAVGPAVKDALDPLYSAIVSVAMSMTSLV
jgi:hypothetical protein